ncbi:MAG TPA: hypothetical protein VFJ09_16460 [Nocardioidaceae bacterium]|nr:hypothetical protein [Nocardioidaceae bacterium]
MSATTRTGVPETSPVARRHDRALWRDPRLIIGIVLVAGSVLLGARLLAHADDSVPVWALRHDLAKGSRVGADDLVLRHVRFFDAADADRYVSAAAVPAASVVTRDLGAGELLPRAALGSAAAHHVLEVPLSVAADAVPASVRLGSVVDVWVAPDASAASATDTGPRRAVRVFDDVTVVAVPATGSSLGPASNRQVVVAVPPAKEAALPSALSRAATGTVVLVKQDGR